MSENQDKAKVDAYIRKHEKWSAVFSTARKALLAAKLEETVKWGLPTYTLEGKNVIGMAGFKNHCALWFHNGSFLKDPNNKLVNAQQGRTRGMRQWRIEEGDKLPLTVLKAYIQEAITNERAGKAIKPQQRTLSIPDELAAALKQNKKLKQAFENLTPGKQREYADHIGGAKQEATRLSRLEKSTPMILAGKGLHDKYKNC